MKTAFSKGERVQQLRGLRIGLIQVEYLPSVHEVQHHGKLGMYNCNSQRSGLRGRRISNSRSLLALQQVQRPPGPCETPVSNKQMKRNLVSLSEVRDIYIRLLG